MAKDKQDTKPEPKPIDPPERPAVVLPIDAGCAVYKDKSGTSLGGGPSEGASNFGAITAAARAILPPDEPTAA